MVRSVRLLLIRLRGLLVAGSNGKVVPQSRETTREFVVLRDRVGLGRQATGANPEKPPA
jgi:hypothetical protein